MSREELVYRTKYFKEETLGDPGPGTHSLSPLVS
jgi:hypothetical protein